MSQKEVSLRLAANKNNIISDYRSRHYTMAQIANKYGAAEPTISNRLKSWGVDTLPAIKRAETGIIEKNKDLIIKLYKEDKLTAAQIAEKTGLGESTINLRLKSWGVPANKRQKAYPEEVLRRFKAGATPEEIAESLQIDSGTIYKVLRYKLGIKHTKRLELNNQERRILKRLYSGEGLSVPQIAKLLKKRRKDPKEKQKITPAALYSRIRELKLKKGRISELQKKALEERIINLFSFGSSVENIAKDMLIPKTTVYEILEKYWQPRYNRGTKLTEEQKQRITRLRKEGYPIREISLKTLISPTTINNIVSSIPHQYYKPFSQEENRILANKIRELRNKPEMPIHKIAKEIGVSTAKVQRIIHDYKIPSVGRIFTAERKRLAVELYNKGLPYTKIAKEIGVSKESVRQELRRLGINLAKSKWSKKYSPRAKQLQKELIKKFYQSPYYYSTIDLAKLIGIDKTTIRTRLVEAGVKIRNMQETYALKASHKRINARITKEQRTIMREKQ